MTPGKKHTSTLKVHAGIEQPAKVNEDAIRKIKAKKASSLTTEDYVTGILAGNRAILGKAITLVESNRQEHQEQAQQIISACLKVQGSKFKVQGKEDEANAQGSELKAQDPDSRIADKSKIVNRISSIRVGITGVPGVGKSTFIEAIGSYLTGKGHRLAVLAVDPSSTRTKGSILGDKTRMENLSADPNAFIRPSPSAGSLGGVTRKTRETIILCEAAGFDVIFVETVGVGQSETAVKSMVDFFLLLMLAGAGDELQGIKRGIIEMADAIIINKADGDNLTKARAATVEYKNALHLFPPSSSGWIPVVDTCSSKTSEGIPYVWEIISDYREKMIQSCFFTENRLEQNKQVLYDAIEEKLRDRFYHDPGTRKKIKKLEQEILAGTKNPYHAANDLLNPYRPKAF